MKTPQRTALLRRAAVAAVLAAASLGAAAQSAAPMSMQQMLEHLSAQGYRDVREIERKSELLYEIKATNDKGQRVEMVVDARSGEVLKQEIKSKGSRS